MAYTTINKHTDYFNTKTWTGTSDATTTVSGVGFQPDFTWIKNRDVADDHMVFDAVRGVTKRLFSNSNGAEGTDAQTLTSFDSDGFTTGNSRATGGDAGNGMVSWNWLGANGTASNTDGSITSTVSANTTAGFSVVSYTGNFTAGATVGHGLGVAPKMVIVKRYNTTGLWYTYHDSLGNGNGLTLESTGASFSTTAWNSTSPTSSVLTFGAQSGVNGSSDTYIAYCFAEKTGYSKFGSYTGNGNADGTFVYTGFKPALVIFKSTGGTESWSMVDNKRDTDNVVKNQLFPNLNVAEETTNNVMDFCSNGFKMRNSDTRYNSSSYTYIYMAFGQSLVGSNNVPCTAR